MQKLSTVDGWRFLHHSQKHLALWLCSFLWPLTNLCSEDRVSIGAIIVVLHCQRISLGVENSSLVIYWSMKNVQGNQAAFCPLLEQRIQPRKFRLWPEIWIWSFSKKGYSLSVSEITFLSSKALYEADSRRNLQCLCLLILGTMVCCWEAGFYLFVILKDTFKKKKKRLKVIPEVLWKCQERSEILWN